MPGTKGDEYVAVIFRSPFHVFDEGPEKSLLIELDGERVGRVKEQGREWSWLQLDSGLMGVMRNKYLRGATPAEVEQFLASEALSGAGRHLEGFSIGVIDLDSNGVPIQSEPHKSPTEGKKVGGRTQDSGSGSRTNAEFQELESPR
jgi:hypothetical protein